MEQLSNILGWNKKVAKVTKKFTPTLDDADIIKEMVVIIKTNRNLFDWAKCLYITPSDKKDMFNVELLMNDNPNETLLAEIYQNHKTQDWQKAKYGHDKPMLNVCVNAETINKIIN
jgi:hypothetical protein